MPPEATSKQLPYFFLLFAQLLAKPAAERSSQGETICYKQKMCAKPRLHKPSFIRSLKPGGPHTSAAKLQLDAAEMRMERMTSKTRLPLRTEHLKRSRLKLTCMPKSQCWSSICTGSKFRPAALALKLCCTFLCRFCKGHLF